jgi:hypothetical protein
VDAVNEEVQAEIENEDGQDNYPAWYVVDEEPNLVTGEQTVRPIESIPDQAKSKTTTEKRKEPRQNP